MPRRWYAWLALGLGVYWSRFLTCLVALDLEPRTPDDPYRSVDPHGFLLMAGFVTTLVLMVPIAWLLLGGGRSGAGSPMLSRFGTAVKRTLAVVAVVGTPTLVQFAYLRVLPFAASWPVALSAAAWLALVTAAMVHTRADLPSPHRAFTAHPVLAWGIVIVMALTMAALPLA